MADAGFDPAVAGRDFDRIVRAAQKADELGLGVLMSGAAGCGKTMAIRALYPRALFVSAFDPIETDWLDRDTLRDSRHVIIDDLGSDAVRNNYGVWESPVLLHVLRADSFRARGRLKTRIHVTTNLTSNEISERYGDRFLSRLLSLCVAVRITGGDKRARHVVR